MSSKTETANLSLGHLGVGKEVNNIETELSEEARTAKRYYDVALNTTVEAVNWPFLTKFISLGLVEEEPTTEWGYSYRYPSDCMHLRRILSGIRNDNRQSRSPYRIAQDSSGKLIFSDEEDAVAEYTVKPSNPALFTHGFTMALSFYLAMLMAPKLTKGDQFKLSDRALKLFDMEIHRAKAQVFNEQQDEEEPEAESIRARD